MADRGAFEAWYGNYPQDLKKTEGGNYSEPCVQYQWDAWRAATKHERERFAKAIIYSMRPTIAVGNEGEGNGQGN